LTAAFLYSWSLFCSRNLDFFSSSPRVISASTPAAIAFFSRAVTGSSFSLLSFFSFLSFEDFLSFLLFFSDLSFFEDCANNARGEARRRCVGVGVWGRGERICLRWGKDKDEVLFEMERRGKMERKARLFVMCVYVCHNKACSAGCHKAYCAWGYCSPSPPIFGFLRKERCFLDLLWVSSCRSVSLLTFFLSFLSFLSRLRFLFSRLRELLLLLLLPLSLSLPLLSLLLILVVSLTLARDLTQSPVFRCFSNGGKEGRRETRWRLKGVSPRFCTRRTLSLALCADDEWALFVCVRYKLCASLCERRLEREGAPSFREKKDFEGGKPKFHLARAAERCVVESLHFFFLKR
jgi:hypothetical protein